MPGKGTELERAKRALAALSVVGRVEAFDAAMGRLKAAYPGIRYQAVKANTSAGKEEVGVTENLQKVIEDANVFDDIILQEICSA
jgi:hypothetical protein